MKKLSFFGKIRAWISAHKTWTAIIILIVIVGGYYIYKKSSSANAIPQYVISPVRLGSITQTVTGSGQVSAENQLDVTSEVSGKIQNIHVTVGQHVNKGDLLATIDSHDALISLESARIAYAKLVKPAKPGDLVNAQNSVTKAYNDGFNAVTDFYLNTPAVMTGMKDILYGQNGFLSDQKSSYLSETARAYRNTAGISYDKAAIQYETMVGRYKNLTRTSATSSIETLINDTYSAAKTIAIALQNLQVAINFITTNQSEYNSTISNTASENVISWSNQINNSLSSIVSSQNTIMSSKNSLDTLVTGAEDLDIQSQRLSLRQAEENYAKYFIRAPFDGIVGRIPVSVYGQAGASTVIATIVGDRKIANISLNEVDAAKVKSGQKATITFDAIDGLNATGTIDRVDLVGTISQGVVSYTVKVTIDTVDERIKPGMSLNVSIITKEKNDVLVVPSSAIKTQGQRKYVEVLTIPEDSDFGNNLNVGRIATTTSTSSTIRTPSITRNGSANGIPSNSISANQTRTMTITSKTAPTQFIVTIGDNDDTHTEILSGLERGQFVVTRTIVSGTATTVTPNILSSLGGNRSAAGAVRATTAPRPGN